MTTRTDAERRRRGLVLVMLAAVLAALFMVPFKLAASDGHGRGAALGLLLGVVMWFSVPAVSRWWRLSPAQRRSSARLALSLTLSAALGNIAQGLAFSRLHPGVTGVLLQTQLLWVALIGWAWLREQVRPALAAGLTLCLAGIAVMQGVGVAGFGPDVGVAWALVAALAFASMDVAARRHAADADSLVANVGRSALAAAAIALVPGALPELVSMSAAQLGALAVAALLGPGLARQLLLMAARDLPASESSLVQQLRPVLALPLTSLSFGIWPAAREWVGSGLILLGVAMPPLVNHLLMRHRLRSPGALPRG